MKVKDAWRLGTDPRKVSWWRRLLGLVPEAGLLRLEEGVIVVEEAGGARAFRADLHHSVGVQLNVWPQDRQRGWLEVGLSQHRARFTFRVSLPWSALPEQADVLMIEGPTFPVAGFQSLWGVIRHAEMMRGVTLPEVRAGLYPDEARHLSLIGLKPLRRQAPPRPAGPYPTPTNRNREDIKAFVRAHSADSFLGCPFCFQGVKAKNLVRHLDKLHYGER